MADFKRWGVKRRYYPELNYNAFWNGSNLTTIRLGEGQAKPLPPEESEFYDVGINTKCNAECSFCYVSANKNGKHFDNICETWVKWMDTFYEEKDRIGIINTNKPFQIAIGSTGEPTIHPQFCEFLETVYNTGVVPNYTTNGLTISKDGELSSKILEYTEKYVGGVAVSYGNSTLRPFAEKAIELLIGKTHVNIHHIIKDKNSVDDMLSLVNLYGDKIKYHVLLPLTVSGRCEEGMEEGTFEYLEDIIVKNDVKNVAFGAKFIKYLESSKVKTWLYPEESFSKNIILEKDCVKITPSSFDLNPIKTIDL